MGLVAHKGKERRRRQRRRPQQREEHGGLKWGEYGNHNSEIIPWFIISSLIA